MANTPKKQIDRKQLQFLLKQDVNGAIVGHGLIGSFLGTSGYTYENGLVIDFSALEGHFATELSSLESHVNSEIGRVETLISTEESRAVAAETSLQTQLSNEITRATAAEATLDGKINQEIIDRGSEITRLEGLISAEESARITAVSDLASDLAAEQSARISADNTLQAAIDAEVSRATAAEGVLQGNIDVEKGRIDAILLASTADADSFKEIVDLINSVDTTNDQAFAGYVTANDARVQQLENDLTSEINRATGAESTIASDLANEIARATGEEGRIEGKFDAITGNIYTALNQEVSDRQAADAAIVNGESTYADLKKVGDELRSLISQNSNSGVSFNFYEEIKVQTANVPPSGKVQVVFDDPNGASPSWLHTDGQTDGLKVTVGKTFADWELVANQPDFSKCQIFLNGVLLQGGVSHNEDDYIFVKDTGLQTAKFRIEFAEGMLEDGDVVQLYFGFHK